MATVTPRTPFAILDETRLQALGSIKNRQNNLINSTPQKGIKSHLQAQHPSSAPAKRRLASQLLSDEDFSGKFNFEVPKFDKENENHSDSENIDPAAKRSKNIDGTPSKVSKFYLVDKISVNQPTFIAPSSAPSLKRKANESISLPTTTSTTPLGLARGTLQKRTLLSGKKRSSLTPFRRINPPGTPGSALPFSIDAALSGTISSYTPSRLGKKSSPLSRDAMSVPTKSSGTKSAMRKEWFFEIYEDTPDEHASNMLQHSASILDISSDDDIMTARAKDALERGKENVPPAEHVAPWVRNPRSAAHRGMSSSKRAMLADVPDAMVEDRKALREMDVSAFVPDGIEAGEVFLVEDEDEVEAEVEDEAEDEAEPGEEQGDKDEVYVFEDVTAGIVEPKA